APAPNLIPHPQTPLSRIILAYTIQPICLDKKSRQKIQRKSPDLPSCPRPTHFFHLTVAKALRKSLRESVPTRKVGSMTRLTPVCEASLCPQLPEQRQTARMFLPPGC